MAGSTKPSKALKIDPNSDATVRDLINNAPDFRDDRRYKLLDKREAYYRGTAYDDRPYEWDGTLRQGHRLFPEQFFNIQIKPESMPSVTKRRPPVQYNMARAIIDRFVSLLFGEHRFPTVKVSIDTPSQEYFNKLLKNIKAKAAFMEAATLGGMSGSVIVMFKIINGRFQLESFNTKFATPLWADYHAGLMEAFRFAYPFQKDHLDKDTKKWKKGWFLYERVVTETQDIIFEPRQLKDDLSGLADSEKDKKPQVQEVYNHAFGFVPAVFIQNLPRYDQIDGDTDSEGAYDLIDRVNELLSSIVGGMHGNLDPTVVIAIAAEEARAAGMIGARGELKLGSQNNGIFVGKDGKASYMEYGGEAAKVAVDLAKVFRDYVLEVTECIIADPHRLSGNAQSAAAIEKLYSHMLAKCDKLRNQYGENGLKRLLILMLRAAEAVKNRGEKLWYPRSKDPKTEKVTELVPDFDLTEDDLELSWGRYFEPMMADTFQAVESANLASGGKAVARLDTLVHFLADYLGDDDPLRSVRELEQQQQEDLNNQLKLAKAGAKPAAPATMKPGVSAKAKPATAPRSDND